MARGRPVAPVILSKTARSELETITRSRVLPHALVRRARIILLAADGWSNTAIAAQVELSGATVGMWRKRFLADGLVGLYDEPRPGGPRSIDDDRIAALIRKTLKMKPPSGTHWSCRTMAAETRLSKSTVQRVWHAFGIQPHRQKHFHLSPDPFFVEKVRDIVGLYLNPPDNALILCVDEKSQPRTLIRGKRSTVSNPCCRWAWDISRGSRITTCAMGQPPYLRRWTLPPGLC
jgi:putative transposase